MGEIARYRTSGAPPRGVSCWKRGKAASNEERGCEPLQGLRGKLAVGVATYAHKLAMSIKCYAAASRATCVQQHIAA